MNFEPSDPSARAIAQFSELAGLEMDAALEALAAMQAQLGLSLAVKHVGSGRYVYANENMNRLFPLARPSLQDASDQDIFLHDDVQAIRRLEQAVMAQRSVLLSEHRLDVAGRRREFSVTRTPLGTEYVASMWTERTDDRHRDAQLQRAMAQIEQQQTALEELRRELQAGSGRDAVSGLYMRAQFDDQLMREVDLSTREYREFALVLLSVDTEQGADVPQAQDRLLEGVGRLLRANTRAMDSACRIGANQFAVLLSGAGLATAHARMEQLRRQCMSQMIVLGGEDLGLSLSVGVASFPHTTDQREELVRAAARAIAEAERRGGNQVVLASIPFPTRSH